LLIIIVVIIVIISLRVSFGQHHAIDHVDNAITGFNIDRDDGGCSASLIRQNAIILAQDSILYCTEMVPGKDIRCLEFLRDDVIPQNICQKTLVAQELVGGHTQLGQQGLERRVGGSKDRILPFVAEPLDQTWFGSF
jgi:hypothetical protein